MNPRTLPAGPETDRLVAEKAMMWHLSDESNLLTTGGWLNARGEYEHCSPTSFLGLKPFSPSTDLAHAMEVVASLRLRGHLFVLTTCDEYGSDGLGPWTVDAVVAGNESSGVLGAHAGTLPLAICRAVLLVCQ